MTTHRLSIFIATVVTGVRATSLFAVEDLLQYIPARTNAVAVVHPDRILRSDRAVREGWAEKRRHDFLAGAAVIPPGVTTFLRASHVHPSDDDHNSSVGVLRFSREIRMDDLAAREGTSLQTLHDRKLIRSLKNCYYIELEPRLLGVVSPAFRQDAARWASSVAKHELAGASSYIREVVQHDTAHIVLAMDCGDLFEPDLLRERVEHAECTEGKPELVDPLYELLLTLRGLRFTATVKDEIEAELILDFSGEVPSDFGRPLKSLLLEVLNDSGAAIEEFERGLIRYDDASFALMANLSDDSLRRVTTLILTPHPAHHHDGIAATTPEPKQKAEPARPERPKRRVRTPSENYYRTVMRIIDDLERANRRATDYNRTATWHDNFARKIDQLPIKDVDPQLIAFGTFVSKQLRALAASLRGVPVEVNLLEKTTIYDVNYDPGWAAVSWWGGVGGRAPTVDVKSNLREVRKKQAEAISRGSAQRTQIWQLLIDERNKARGRLGRAYGDK